MRVNVDKLDEPTTALLCGISKDAGIEHFKMFPKSVNKEKFIEYCKELRHANPDKKICLFMDRLGAHKCDWSKEEMRKLKIRWILNVPYSPEYNPIEMVFSQVKRNYK